MEHLHNLDSVHQLLAVQRALKTIQKETEFTQIQIDELAKYFHYLYSIGYHQGSRQNAHRKRVIQKEASGKIIQVYESTTEAALVLGVHKSSIGKCIKKNYKCKGFFLTFENNL